MDTTTRAPRTPFADGPRVRVFAGAVVCIACVGLIAGWWLDRRADPAPGTGARAEHSRTVAPDTSPASASAARVTAPGGAAAGPDPSDHDQARIDAAMRMHWERVLREGDARQRLIALRSLAIGGFDSEDARRRARSIAAAALAEAPDDPLVAQMQAWFCADAQDACTPAQRDAWSRLEPGNAAAFADAITRGQDDPSQLDRLLASAAGGDRYDSHYHSLMLETIAASEDAPLPPMTEGTREGLRSFGLPPTEGMHRRVVAAGAAFALPMSTVLGISRACRPPISAWRARDCRIVLRRMAAAPTLVERSIAYALLARLTAGTAEGVHWALQERRLRWWMQQSGDVVASEAYWEDFLRFGEVEAVRRAMLARHRPLDPPPGWRAPGT